MSLEQLGLIAFCGIALFAFAVLASRLLAVEQRLDDVDEREARREAVAMPPPVFEPAVVQAPEPAPPPVIQYVTDPALEAQLAKADKLLAARERLLKAYDREHKAVAGLRSFMDGIVEATGGEGDIDHALIVGARQRPDLLELFEELLDSYEKLVELRRA